ncbi:MAG: hypothetical protein QM809_10885 [Gordonia sp. (in: high G+C Gram-positive bacteria)]|uniref:hypothetical protein n=1 Tax=Gordonia sp. (in: high G+C Gram-positive bacteria) TaxID=84139 RepID=UPI0039E5C4EC
MAEKKKVRVEAKAPARKKNDDGTAAPQTWEATPEAKAQALKLRIIAGVLWVIAIGLEIFTIVWALAGDKEFDTGKLWIVIGLVVVIGILSITGSFLWKRSNRLDPASEKDGVRFFVQNQLGAIVAVVAFLPLLIFVLADGNLSGKQKGILGGIVAVVLAGALWAGVDTENPSVEKYTEDDNIITLLHNDPNAEVVWTKSGKVYHVCDKVPAVNQESTDGTIYNGTTAAAQEAGKSRLTKQWKSEARVCGFGEDDIARVDRGLAANPSTRIDEDELGELDDEAPAASVTTTPSPVTTTPSPATSTR